MALLSRIYFNAVFGALGGLLGWMLFSVFGKQIFALKKDRSVVPHGHDNMCTGFIILRGSFSGKHYFFSGAVDNGDLAGVFVHEEYSALNVYGQNVIDIGANIGDSAIYFAAKGARHVYAFEPFPSTFECAKNNVEINDLREKITIINAGLSDADGDIAIDAGDLGLPGLHRGAGPA